VSEEREMVPDLFGDLCLVLDRCPRCGEPKIQRQGETGWTHIHAKGCHLNQGAWHQEARATMDEAGMRDLAQIEHRVREYGANTSAPAGYRGPRRAPSKTEFT
jgi:hypothetical protein